MPCPRAGQRNHRTAGRHQLGQQDDGNTQPVGRLQRVQPQPAYRLPLAAKTARRARRCHPSWNEHRCKQQHYPAECHYPAQGGGSTTAVRPSLLAPAGAAGAYELRRRINTAWVAGTHYQFASLAIPHDANSTAAAVLAAIGAEDWPTLYSLAGTSLRNAAGRRSHPCPGRHDLPHLPAAARQRNHRPHARGPMPGRGVMTRPAGARRSAARATAPAIPGRWTERALRAQADPDAWFPTGTSASSPRSPSGSAPGARCGQCLEYALSGADSWGGIATGIWSGTTPQERDRL
jgi:Transcription factor WhiB